MWHIYAPVNQAVIDSEYGLSHVRCQGILWTNACLLSTWTSRNRFQLHFDWNWNFIIKQTAYQKLVCSTAKSLSLPQCVKWYEIFSRGILLRKTFLSCGHYVISDHLKNTNHRFIINHKVGTFCCDFSCTEYTINTCEDKHIQLIKVNHQYKIHFKKSEFTFHNPILWWLIANLSHFVNGPSTTATKAVYKVLHIRLTIRGCVSCHRHLLYHHNKSGAKPELVAFYGYQLWPLLTFLLTKLVVFSFLLSEIGRLNPNFTKNILGIHVPQNGICSPDKNLQIIEKTWC